MPSDYRDPAQRYRAETAACPHIAPDYAEQLSDQGIADALDLIVDAHDVDPRQLWGRLVLWGQNDPPRLVAATVALAAMHHPETPGRDLDANVRAAAGRAAINTLTIDRGAAA